ncbi:hypothetical protein DXG03_003523 [Asterophora parasitica]|uniref:Protein kinase domain-containing protein n=1 Tax=Asterophora parasitica TaxID=117018 RepID=A0A9P7GD29_9AGAR|nr:hypothetical protein DXG03_003523 [Asterophora parasitica]
MPSSQTSPTKFPPASGFEPTLEKLEPHRERLDEDMVGLLVGPMPMEEFLREFVPEAPHDAPPLEATHFNSMPEDVKKESEMYQPFIDLIADHNILPGFKIVDTSNHPDPDGHRWKIKPDPSIYLASLDTSKKKTQWGELECHIELKPNDAYDGFRDPPSNVAAEGRLAHQFEADAEKRAKTRSQLIHYATEWCSRQHRLFAFTVYIGDPYARFIRWDRSGAIVSEQFDYRTNSKPLIEFLWRFSHLDDAGRGRDTSVRLATTEEKNLAEKVLLQWAPAKKKERPVVVFTVPVEGGDPREFIGWGSMAYPESLTGRCTRAYPVFELVDPTKLCFLKDTWRAHDLDPESKVLIELKSKGVENIPPFLCGGDLPDATVTDLFVPEPKGEGPASSSDSLPLQRAVHWRCGNNTERVVRRVHHRFVVDFVGKHLDKVRSSMHLMQVCADAYIALRQAYEKCGYIHRDVSGKNILIDEHGRGVLNDWDLAKKKSELQSRRRHEKTGTWEFMSCLLLMSISTRREKVHTIQDDMESLFYVIFYHCVRYFPHSKATATIYIIENIFQNRGKYADGTVVGGDNKRGMILNQAHIGDDFRFTAEPLQEWLVLIVSALQQWIEFAKPAQGLWSKRTGAPPPAAFKDTSNPPEHLDLRNHQFMDDLFQSALESTDWPLSNDAPIDSFPALNKQASETAHRRAHNASLRTSGKRNSSAMASEPDSDVRSSDGPLKKKSKTYGTAPSTHTMSTRRGGGGDNSMGGSSNSRTT